ncbi:hypothetical protein Nepgr_006649 [Nepenthes gracilis]|uniref:Uncharacterized protein n=1 Tax=Nepenthes gracilis TaxID=150966 RepID=A0AAD3S5S0_NEPGR|nr:hypothetical protein Nepgr_006649 [Nepenthes gracilis]
MLIGATDKRPPRGRGSVGTAPFGEIHPEAPALYQKGANIPDQPPRRPSWNLDLAQQENLHPFFQNLQKGFTSAPSRKYSSTTQQKTSRAAPHSSINTSGCRLQPEALFTWHQQLAPDNKQNRVPANTDRGARKAKCSWKKIMEENQQPPLSAPWEKTSRTDPANRHKLLKDLRLVSHRPNHHGKTARHWQQN